MNTVELRANGTATHGWIRRIARWVTVAALGIWVALALLVSAGLGFGMRTLLVGMKTPPLLTAELFTRDAKSFSDLPDTPAIPVLHRDFGPAIGVSDGRRLYDMVVSRGYRRALDVGTGNGYAALWLGMAMRATGGKAITIEIDPATARQARRNIQDAQLENVVDLRINDVFREVPAIPGDFDFVFLDLGGVHHERLLEMLSPRLAPGGAIVSHNALGLRFTAAGYLPAAWRNANLETGILPTLSGGLAISVKTARE